MIKIKRIALIIWWLCLMNVCFASTITDNLIKNIEGTNQNKTDAQKIQNFESYLTTIQNQKWIDSTTKTTIQNYLKTKITELKKKQTSYSGYNTPNINIQKIRDTRLALHNQERKNVWANIYTYSTTLERTAFNRATYLNKIGKSTHQRTPQDGYYSYINIRKWFDDQWVLFKTNKWTLFSESIWRNIYNCTKKDCTDDLIKAMKPTFAFFMSEKGKSYKPHYNWIVLKSFTKMGVGVNRNPQTKKIFIVTHYSVDLKN